MRTAKTVTINSEIKLTAGGPLLLIAGPCQIESYDHCCKIGSGVIEAIKDLPFNYVFKSSFDKANRTSMSGERGVGISEGLEILDKVKKTLGVPILTDIHNSQQASLVAEVADVLQIPAFLCRQTDLLVSAGKTNKAINIKKGQFLHPNDMKYCAEKVASSGNENIMLCERGTCFGYRDLVVDMRGLIQMAETGYPVVFDATHSVASMGGAGGSSSGSREYVPHLARAAVAAGVSGIFLECHDDPDNAPSDGATMLRMNSLPTLLESLAKIHSVAQSGAQ